MTQHAGASKYDVTANHYANGGLAGATDYYFTHDALTRKSYPLMRVHRTGTVEMRGVARNSEWSRLVEAMLDDQRQYARNEA